MQIPFRLLGQSGIRLAFPGAVIYVDPYLSDSVRELVDDTLERQLPIPIDPADVTDADWLLITHDHMDHCDPHTLPKIAKASPASRFVGPFPVLDKLRKWGIEVSRLITASEEWITIADNLRLRAVPAAHPEIERNRNGELACVGYLLDYFGKILYIAGDTSVHQEIIDNIKVNGQVYTAILPVNEHNFFRGRKGIIGNMSVREAFLFAREIGAKQVIPVHWDMFADNSVFPDEIRIVYEHMKPGFSLLMKTELLNLSDFRVSIIIRTLNEVRYIEQLLQSIKKQDAHGLPYEVILVDSGSTDGTVEIAEKYGCKIYHIRREDFSFGRSLNIGCEAASGDILVIISGHCIPKDEKWLKNLCQPILNGKADYTYGRQFGGKDSYFSECRIFEKYFPKESKIPQEGYFCNNANSALSKKAWKTYRFNEELTGLEDLELAKRLVADGGKVAYVAEAGVYHYHHENWAQVKRRFEREAIALQYIMPHIHMRRIDFVRYLFSSIAKDLYHAYKRGQLIKHAMDIVRYRYFQYMGSFNGNYDHRKLSHEEKEKYFYPT